MELLITPAWFKAVNAFALLDKAGVYEEPPNHRVIKCQESKEKKQN
tara:strand:- start:3739 stop:3876 length:138 start_codon:yes stop_codon:yes gene_type:complete